MRIVSNKISYFTWKVKEKIFESDLVILESDTFNIFNHFVVGKEAFSVYF